MSTILKALKKTEKEKGAASGGTVSISREVLRTDAKRRRTSPLRLPLIVIGLLTLGVGTGIFLVRTEEVPLVQLLQEEPLKSLESVATVPPASVVAPEVTAVQNPEPVSDPVTVPAVAVAVVAQPEPNPGTTLVVSPPPQAEPAFVAQVEIVTPDRVTPPAPPQKNSVVKPVAPVKVAVAVPVPQAIAQPVASRQPVVATPRSRMASSRSLLTPVVVPSRQEGWLVQDATDSKAPNLRVSEIHWRPIAKERLAVVNDLPVLEGVDIEGIRVDRIFKDRIRFVVNGRYLEVKLSSVSAP